METKQAERPQTLFATPVQSAETMAAQVRLHLERTYTNPPPGVDLAVIARRAVDELWESRVKIFVPVLALREARDVLRNGQGTASA